MPVPLHNRFLFSHHYLERICQEADNRQEPACRQVGGGLFLSEPLDGPRRSTLYAISIA